MQDHHLRAPLAPFAGRVPPAPSWFVEALAAAPERAFHVVAGARIETLCWGEPGRPGLLFMHGNGAHADWWSFIAPFFARDFRVAALSWSGMGASDWRSAYTLDLHVEEAFGVAAATGLFDGPDKPVFIGHSFGGYPTLAAASRMGDRLGGAIVIDTPLATPEARQARHERLGPPREPHATQIYPTRDAALARFRFMPVQPCENLFIADHIARHSLKQVTTGEGDGWTWRFDPFMWKDYDRSDAPRHLAGAACPLAMIFGETSAFLRDGIVQHMTGLAPAGTPVVMIPDAGHHVMVDQPLALVSALRALLAGHIRRGRSATAGRPATGSAGAVRAPAATGSRSA